MANHQTKIEKLINEFCPEGVEFKELGEVVSKRRFKQLGASQLEKLRTPKGNIKLLPSSKNYDWWTSEELGKDYINEGEVITLGRARYANLKYYEGKFISSNNIIITSRNKKRIINRYLYYFILSKVSEFYIVTSTYPKFDNNIFSKFKIPIPPLPIQKEIVKILDNFTKLEAELEAELEARRRQYEYYRNKLLTFKNDEVEWKELSEVCELKNGYTPSKANSKYWNNGTIPWFRMEDIRINGRILKDSIQHITLEAVKGGRLFPANSIIVATSATIGEHALITEPFLSNQRFTVFSIKKEFEKYINVKFLFYYGFILGKWCKNNITKSNFSSVDMTKLRKFKIPIPPLEKQKQIVAILDKFDALVNDISSGLPAEIKARRQQYEYYRRKLLTFKEKK